MATANLEYLFSYNVGLRMPPEVIGEVPEGIRINIYLTGGDISGPRLNGKVEPVGADWLLLRRDGTGVVDVRTTFTTNDGALIYASYLGILDTGEDGYQRFLEGHLPPTIPIRTAPRLQTAHPNYIWLNRLQCYSIGNVDMAASRVSYDVFTAP